MTQDEIIHMARELVTKHGIRMCDEDGETHGEELYCVCVEDIAEIIKHAAAHLFTYNQVKSHIQAAIITERDACAKVCDKYVDYYRISVAQGSIKDGCEYCAAAIRARGKNDCGGAQHHRYAGSFGG